MDYNEIIHNTAKSLGRTDEEATALGEGLVQVIRDCAAQMDSVAIPTFGTFVPVKHPERITTDLSTGRRLMLPPEITLTFEAGGVLKKNINGPTA